MSAAPKKSPATRARELFLGALEKTVATERAAFLAAGCGGDDSLRQRVDELLREHEEVGSFLETPAMSGARNSSKTRAVGPAGTELIAAVIEKPGDRIGRYKLLQQIGEGGCGVVYMAEQEEPVRRRVALKVIKLGMDTKSVIARFEAERQALAMMDHPNIAKVFDAGATEAGRPYFVMELVRGIRITEYCDQNNLATELRLKLVTQVCQAIQHAHQKGIIHRDIKPSNILVTLHDGVPVPKVIDFGIAKATDQRLTDKTLFTEFTSFVGTPAYMSPEQAEMSGLDIDTRSDIYALGVLLYELLIGRTPFDAERLFHAGIDECRRTIREEEPVRPSTRLETMVEADLTTTARQRHTEAQRLIHLLRGDLDWIAMKCLEKDRTRRYATASDLAADLQRYLDGEPVLARPPSNLYRFQKLLRRHRGTFAAAAAIAIALLTGAVFSTWLAVRATRAEHRAESSQHQESRLRQQAEQDRTFARLNEYVADINLAQQSLAAGNYGRAFQLVDKHEPLPGAPDLRGFEWRYLRQLCQGDEHVSFPAQESGVQSVACSPNGEWLAVGLSDKINVWSIRARSLVTTLPKGGLSTVFSPDGKTLISASRTSLRAWRTSDWSEQTSLSENTAPISLSADGKRLATVGFGKVRVWDTSNWTQQRAFPGASGPVAFSPDGKTLATDSKAGLTLWPLEGVQPERVLQDSTNMFRGGPWSRNDRALAFSPDGKALVAARNTLSERGVFVLSIWDVESGEETVLPDDADHIEHTGIISSLAFSPDGHTLATASMDHSIRLWDFATLQPITALQGHLHEVWAVALSPDGQSVVSGAKDGSVNWWPTLRQKKKEEVIAGSWQPLAFSKDSRTLAALNRDGAVVFFNAATSEPEQQFQLSTPSPQPQLPFSDAGPPGGARYRGATRFRFPTAVAFSDNLRLLAHSVEDGTVKLVDTQSHDARTLKASDRPVDLVALSPDGNVLITGGRAHSLRWWDTRAGTNTVLTGGAQKALFSPDGRTLALLQRGDSLFPPDGRASPEGRAPAVSQRGDSVQFWDVATRSQRTNFITDPQLGFEAAFSHDSRVLALACQDDAIRLWDVATGKLLGVCTGHKQGVFSVAFAPDGKTLATASDDSTLKLWNVTTQQELLTVRRLGGALRDLLFSPDGQLLVGASGFMSRAQSGGLRFYRAPVLRETAAVHAESDRKARRP